MESRLTQPMHESHTASSVTRITNIYTLASRGKGSSIFTIYFLVDQWSTSGTQALWWKCIDTISNFQKSVNGSNTKESHQSNDVYLWHDFTFPKVASIFLTKTKIPSYYIETLWCELIIEYRKTFSLTLGLPSHIKHLYDEYFPSNWEGQKWSMWTTI